MIPPIVVDVNLFGDLFWKGMEDYVAYGMENYIGKTIFDFYIYHSNPFWWMCYGCLLLK